MNPMTAFTLRTFSKNKVRSLVTVIGVLLATALITGVFTCVSSLNDLLLRTEQYEDGNWMAAATASDPAYLEQAAHDDAFSDVAVIYHYPTVVIGEEEATRYGTYLPLIGGVGDLEQVCGIRVSEGALPATSHEIMLPARLESSAIFGDQTVEIGSTITVDCKDGETRTFEIVGFYDNASNAELISIDGSFFAAGFIGSDEDSAAALDTGSAILDTSSESEPSEHTLPTVLPDDANSFTLYLVLDHAQSRAQISDVVSAAFPETTVELHVGLLANMGMFGESALGDTIEGFAGLIIAIIVISSIAFIYNAFAISVADRTRQFGLLSSVGASKRQIRRSILFESLIIAAIGIPLGLIAGIGGSGVVLYLLTPLFDLFQSNSEITFRLYVSLPVIACCIGITLATVLTSAWIPALKASRTSAIAAIQRTGEIRLKPRYRKRGASPDESSATSWKVPTFAPLARLFGLPGTLATINRKRGASQGRIASISLGLAVVLVITSGAFTLNLRIFGNVLDTDIDYDIGISTIFTEPPQGANPEESTTLADAFDEFATAYQQMTALPGVEAKGWYGNISLPVVFPNDMVGNAFEKGYTPDIIQPDGKRATFCSVVIMEDEQFSRYASSVGADGVDFNDPSTIRAIAVAGSYQASTEGQSAYTKMTLFEKPGPVDLLLSATYEGTPTYAFTYDTHNGKEVLGIYNTTGTTRDDGTAPEDAFVPLTETTVETTTIELTVLTDTPPEMRRVTRFFDPMIIVPRSSALFDKLTVDQTSPSEDASPERAHYVSFYGALDSDDHVKTDNELRELHKPLGSGFGELFINDYAASTQSSVALVNAIELFALLFSIVLTLIAMANVFTTLTNGLLLRQREFAMLRSIGMGNRDFRKMIVCECLGYSLRGVIPGVIVGIIVAFAVHDLLGMSVEGVPYLIPWGSIGLALVLVAIVTAASVAYGLHRSRANNIIEALRLDVA